MSPVAIVISLLRKSYTKTGAISAVEAVPGALAALVAVLVCRYAKVEISDVELFAIYTAGPAISSYVLGTIRHTFNDIMTAFQRGTSEPTTQKEPST